MYAAASKINADNVKCAAQMASVREGGCLTDQEEIVVRDGWRGRDEVKEEREDERTAAAKTRAEASAPLRLHTSRLYLSGHRLDGVTTTTWLARWCW